MGKELKSGLALKAGMYATIFITNFSKIWNSFLLGDSILYMHILTSMDARDQILNFKNVPLSSVFNTC